MAKTTERYVIENHPVRRARDWEKHKQCGLKTYQKWKRLHGHFVRYALYTPDVYIRRDGEWNSEPCQLADHRLERAMLVVENALLKGRCSSVRALLVKANRQLERQRRLCKPRRRREWMY